MVQHSLKVSGCFNKPASEGKSVLRSCLLDLILAQNSVAWNVCHIPAGSLFRCHIPGCWQILHDVNGPHLVDGETECGVMEGRHALHSLHARWREVYYRFQAFLAENLRTSCACVKASLE